MSTARTCPVNGCDIQLLAAQPMCFEHWSKLPKPHRVNVWEAWNDGTPTPGYARVCEAAVDAASGKEKK